MSLRDNIHEWIHSYLNGQMGEEEKSEFEKMLQTDQEFAKMVQAQKISYQIVVGQELLKLKAQMTKDLGGKNAVAPKNHSWKYIVGAAIIASIAVILYFLFKNPEDRPPLKNEKPSIPATENIGPLRGSSDTVPTLSEPELNQDSKNIDPTPETKTDPVEKKNSCGDSLISFSCQARAACTNQDNGAIEVDVNTIKSGKAPYEFSISAGGGFVSEGIIKELKAGKYNLYVKDAGNCIRKLNVKIEVPEISCDQKHK